MYRKVLSRTIYILFLLLLVCGAYSSDNPAHADANAYHWNGQAQFFEGWYFKVSDPETGKSFLFIYAVFNPDGNSPHSCGFMMAGANTPDYDGLIYQEYPVDAFSASYDLFDIAVSADNRALGDLSTLHAGGSVADGVNTCSWNFDFIITRSWDSAMGWMEALPDLQTYWHVGAMKAAARGWIEWNGDLFEFENAIGYQEKNWGDEFPETWYWLQANHFDDPKACCLSVGAASMPIGSIVFPACGIGLIYDDRLYTFSFPQEPALIKAAVEPGAWKITARNGRHKIIITASADTSRLLNLRNPTVQGIKTWTWETVTGTVRFELYAKKWLRWVKIGEATSDLAGAEFGGAKWLGWDRESPVP